MNKNIDYYMKLPYTIKISPYEEGSFFAEVEELPGCMTEADSKEEVLHMIEDAKLVWIQSALDDGAEIPEPIDTDYSGKFNLRIPKSLHKALATKAAREGTSLNTYLISKLAA